MKEMCYFGFSCCFHLMLFSVSVLGLVHPELVCWLTFFLSFFSIFYILNSRLVFLLVVVLVVFNVG